MAKVKVQLRKKGKKASKPGRKAKTVMAKKSLSARFGPVSSIDTAPVAIGNSIRGSQSQVIQSKDGVIVRSRDFMFPATATGTIQTWTLCGGTPIAPAVFSDSTLRNYMQMYQKFRWRKLTAHYITSSATTATGDVMFYHQKNRESVFLNQTSTQLLPFVLNDDDTVIGPQWTNHSVDLHITGEWKSTDYGMTAELEQYAEGDLFLLSKTSTLDSPGYVLFDFEVQFSELQISPRLLSLPVPRAQWNQMNIGLTATPVTVDTQVRLALTGTGINGSASTHPAGVTNGDVYKLIVDLTNSNSGSWVNGNALSIVRSEEPGGYSSTILQDGTTLYAVYNGSAYCLYANASAAFASGGGFIAYCASVTLTANLQVWVSYIGSLGSINLNPNF